MRKETKNEAAIVYLMKKVMKIIYTCKNDCWRDNDVSSSNDVENQPNDR